MNAWPLSRVRQVATFYSQGLDEAGIAEKLGVTKQAIFSLIGQRKAIFPPPALPPLDDDGAFLIARAEARATELERRRQLAGPVADKADYVPGLADLADRLVRPSGPIPLMKLTNGTCRWPVSGHGQATLFCGDATAVGSSWCGCHRARAAQKNPNLNHERTGR